MLTIIFFEFHRQLALVILYFNGVVAVILKFSRILQIGKQSVPLNFKMYNRMRIILNSAQSFLDPLIGFVMFVLLSAGILGWYMAIALPNVLTFPVNVVSPSAIIFVTTGVLQGLIAPLAKLHTQSSVWCREMQRKPLQISPLGNCTERKIMFKKVKSLRVLAIHASFGDYRLFQIKKSTPLTFNESLISFTISLLLSPLASQVKWL